MLFEEIGKANIQALKDHDKTARAILSVLYGKFKNESITTNITIQKMPNATEWENQSNECIKYICDKENGVVSYFNCKNDEICLNDKCKSIEDINDDKQIIEIEIEDEVYSNESDLVSTSLCEPQSTPPDSPLDPETYK